MQQKRDSIYKHFNPAITISPENNLNTPAYWFVYSSNNLLVTMDGTGAIRLPFGETLEEWQIQPIRKQYLGQWNDSPCYSVEVAPNADAPEGMVFKGLFTLYGAIDDDLILRQMWR